METLSKLPPAFRKDGIVGGERERNCGWRGGGGGDARENSEGARAETDGANYFVGDGRRGSRHHGNWPGAVIAEGAAAAGLKMEQMDRVEVNEAFAPQYLAVEKALGLNRDKNQCEWRSDCAGASAGARRARGW